MPHDGPVELVRQCPDMAVDFVRAVGGIKLPPEVTAELAPTDMSAAVPVQFLADMVVLISSAKTGKPVLAVVIEPQLRDRPRPHRHRLRHRPGRQRPRRCRG